MAKLDSAELRLLLNELREPLGVLARDIAQLDRDGLPSSIEPIAKTIQSSMGQVLIALADIEAALEKATSGS